ncbi:MAG: T9SS type A sorting domain-containing protein, partial [Flavobacteriales bacterium]
ITLSSSSQDDMIGIYSRSGSTFSLLPGGSENSSSTMNDMERLNYSGLTPGQTYYVCVGSADNNGGAYTMCLQNLLSSGCATVAPVGGLNLCSTFKSLYRGSSAQGVTYNFSFTGVGGGASGTSTLTNTNGLIVLSNPSLGLRYGGVYDIQVDANYALQDGVGTTENISVAGTLASLRCDNVTMINQPNLEVKSTQRCSVATLSRYSYLNASRVNSNPVCGATSYTWVFKRMDDCATPSPTAIDSIVATTPSVYCQLSVLPDMPAAVGTWGVKVRPNFSYGNGTFGPERYIAVNGTSASSLAPENLDAETMREISQGEMVIYPNPTSNNSVNVYAGNLIHDQIQIRVIDATGRIVQTNSYFLMDELNTTLEFNNQLAPGIYSIELNDGGITRSSRLLIN